MSHMPGDVLKALVKLGREPGDCWMWLGTINHEGVACKQYHGKLIPARRWMWMQLFGPIPDGLVVTNTCQNKACINPFHLRACTQADACRASVQTLFLPSEVVEIRRAKKDAGPNTARVLADKIGCSPQTIRDIWRRTTWSRARPNYGPRKRARSEEPTVSTGVHA